MSMTEWAKREVEIASKRERGDKPESEWDYGCACYDSALKAFESLCGDGHSGFSIGITKGILNRLIDGKPLTPIEDIEDVWNVCSRGENGGVVTYQCKRMSFDTLAVLYIQRSHGEKVEVNRYFKEGEKSFIEISPEEYEERKKMHEKRQEQEDKAQDEN